MAPTRRNGVLMLIAFAVWRWSCLANLMPALVTTPGGLSQGIPPAKVLARYPMKAHSKNGDSQVTIQGHDHEDKQHRRKAMFLLAAPLVLSPIQCKGQSAMTFKAGWDGIKWESTTSFKSQQLQAQMRAQMTQTLLIEKIAGTASTLFYVTKVFSNIAEHSQTAASKAGVESKLMFDIEGKHHELVKKVSGDLKKISGDWGWLERHRAKLETNDDALYWLNQLEKDIGTWIDDMQTNFNAYDDLLNTTKGLANELKITKQKLEGETVDDFAGCAFGGLALLVQYYAQSATFSPDPLITAGTGLSCLGGVATYANSLSVHTVEEEISQTQELVQNGQEAVLDIKK